MTNLSTVSKYRSLVRTVSGEHKIEGPGIEVRRPFPIRALDHVDPFLLLDEAGPSAPRTSDDMGDHPHRGFETLTYLLSGSLLSHDSSGFKDTFHSGDVEWTTAGSGIVHGGRPIGNETMHGIQLWVNLPRDKKWIAPKSSRIEAASIPNVTNTERGYTARIISGKAEGTEGPVNTTWPITYLHYTIEKGGAVSLETTEGQNAMLYVLRGQVDVNGGNVHEGQLGILSDGKSIEFSSDDGAELIVLASEPIGEPVARYGPFVMNEREEVFQAFDDFNAGKFPMLND